jgi:hypothetical protein
MRTLCDVNALAAGLMAVLVIAHPAAPALAAGPSQSANVQLHSAAVTLTQTSDTQWTLTKTGSTGAAAVTWAVRATQGPTTAGMLIYNGIFKVDNKGSAGATIGNIVVNLQTKQGSKWVTQSSVIADATQDDAATHANVAPAGSSEGRSSFDENGASGQLLYTDESTNSTFALVPEVTLPPDATTTLLFTASFDNSVLNLAPGTPTRAEVIVSFGNAKQTSKKSAADVDINGNGIVDPDEAWVQSVDARFDAPVPAPTPSNATVTLSDSASDITTTGTVTFSNPQITLDQTTHSGTVIVDYLGGASGGTITNCAHLTSSGQTLLIASGSDAALFPNVLALDVTACDTQVIGPRVCIPGRPGCGWADGDMLSWSQVDWSWDDYPARNFAAMNLASNFGIVYPFSAVEIGISGLAGFSMIFTSAPAIFNYLTQGGTPGPLTSDLLDPTSSSAGAFGGAVLAMRLDIDFGDAGFLPNASGQRFGDLRLCNLPQTSLNGLTMREFMTVLNTALGGGSTGGLTYDELYAVAENASGAFIGGLAYPFAQQHIVSGLSCS